MGHAQKRTHYQWRQLRKAMAPVLCQPGVDYREVAAEYQISVNTARKYHQIVQDEGPEALINLHDGRPYRKEKTSGISSPKLRAKAVEKAVEKLLRVRLSAR